MPVTIPSPLGAPPQGRPGTFEQILLGLASSAPQLLTFFLDRQARQNEQQATQSGQNAAAIAALTGSIGALDPAATSSLVEALGGITQQVGGFQMPPLAGVEGAQPGPEVSGVTTGIDLPEGAPIGSALAQALEFQRTKAQTDLALGQSERLKLLTPAEVARAKAQTAQANVATERERLALVQDQIMNPLRAVREQAGIDLANAQAINSIASARRAEAEIKRVDAVLARERSSLIREQVLLDRNALTNTALAILQLSPIALEGKERAKALGAAQEQAAVLLGFGRVLSPKELRIRAEQLIDGGLDEATILLEYESFAAELGVPTLQATATREALILNNADPQATYDEAVREGEFTDEQLSALFIYITAISGKKIKVPPSDPKGPGLLKRLRKAFQAAGREPIPELSLIQAMPRGT